MPKSAGAIGVKLRIDRVQLYGGKTTAEFYAVKSRQATPSWLGKEPEENGFIFITLMKQDVSL